MPMSTDAENTDNGVCESSTSPYGYFCDSFGYRIWPGEKIVTASWCNDGTRDMILTEPVRYVTPKGNLITVPVGFRTDGLSVPWFFRRIVPCFEPRSREASVVHDWLVNIGMEWGPAAYLFWCAMRSNAFSPFRARNRWAAVNWVGRWFCSRHRARRVT
jgi:hypothetical protein